MNISMGHMTYQVLQSSLLTMECERSTDHQYSLHIVSAGLDQILLCLAVVAAADTEKVSILPCEAPRSYLEWLSREMFMPVTVMLRC